MRGWTPVLLCLGLMFCQVSCLNPFAPKLETSFGNEVCSDLTDIENLFCVFRNAYAFKDTSLYGSIIGSTFIFSYRDYDQAVDVTWGRDDEMRSTYGLFQSVQTLNLVWNNEISSDSGATRRTIIRGFSLTVTFNPGEIDRVDGYADLTFERARDTDPWHIVHWRDESNY
jgi:hypothetical protein